MKLFEPLQIRNVTLKNRIVLSPMCMYSAEADGFVTPFHEVHYASRSIGGTGLTMIEATAVSPEGRLSNNDLGIWSDAHTEGHKRLVQRIHESGSHAAIQLAHGGRKGRAVEQTVAPSVNRYDDTYPLPVALTTEEVETMVDLWRDAAARAIEAGYDVLEIHAAHGYLIHQFLSPLSNERTDQYGGSAANRYRFLSEVIAAIRAIWDGPLFVRVSASDYHSEGLDVTDFVSWSHTMREAGVDLIDVSTGVLVPATFPVFPGYQVSFAERIRHEGAIATGAVGLITTGNQAEEILQNGRADLVFIGREFLRDPYWPRTAARQLGTNTEPPKQYARGW
ncbi:MAG: NADPH dehydrogenase NamA [Bacilli bacterium]